MLNIIKTHFVMLF